MKLARSCVVPLLLLLAVACTIRPVDKSRAHGGMEDPELSDLMGEMQRHAAKLGYSIQSRNARLAEFYLEEIREVTEELLEIRKHDGLPVGDSVRKILQPKLVAFEETFAGGDWAATRISYENLIDSCNRCHASTEHEYIVVLPAKGEPPFSQQFRPGTVPAP